MILKTIAEEAAIQKIEPGIYDCPPAFGVPMLRQSIARALLVSPLHGWWKAFGEQPEPWDDTRNFGSVCHALIASKPGKVVSVDAPDWRTAAAKEKREEILAEGKYPVLFERLNKAICLVDRTRDLLGDAGYSLTGQSEVTVIWSMSGVVCRGTLDHLILPPPRATKKRAIIFDFKFPGSEATLKACENRFVDQGYDIQHAAYVESIETIFPKLRGRVDMIYVFAETEPPYAVRIAPLAGSMKTSGLWRWAKAREIWKECLKKYGESTPWPGYKDDGSRLECPAWMLNAQLEEAEIEEREE